jgi:hypothetical protein
MLADELPWARVDVVLMLHLAGPLVIVPVVTLTVLWVSRRRHDARWAQRATWPLWGLVELTLKQARRGAEDDRDESRSDSRNAEAA